jgi:primosomal protein N' (replication factor Y)
MSKRFVSVAFNLPLSQSFTYECPEQISAPLGSRVVAPFGRRTLSGFVVGEETEPPADVTIKPISRVTNAEPLFDAPYLELADWVRRMYLSSLGEALAAMIPGGRKETAVPGLAGDEPPPAESDLQLSDEQEQAIEAIFSDGNRLSYLYGITGSGKTEVFLQAAERVISEGKSVIYLVPEIALSHQLLESVAHRFHGQLAVLHSRLSPSQRLTEWQRIRRGEARMVIGARSAVFAPVPDLGLIVLDEEHDGSYKSGSSPRYHARQVAMKRIADAGGRMIMGSATPSVEAWHLMEQGTISRLTLTRRLSGGSMPSVESIDLLKDPGPLSERLLAALKETHNEGRQSILFLNRRGFAHFFHCKSCGYTMQCRNCSVGMTYHKSRDLLTCHYCGYKTRPVNQCPDCGSFDVGYSGFGTERIAEELTQHFPEWTVRRLDTDAVRKKGVLEETIAAFKSGEIDVLLGTQMVAKGLNFPGVKLVGIILADTGLHMPDFRAAERTFSLIVQVAGRAGRFHPDGRVIVQTYAPDNPAVSLATGAAMEQFYRQEIAARQALGFPPFERLIRLVIRGRDAGAVAESAASLARELGGQLTAASELLGPVECPLSVIAGNTRHQILVRTARFGLTHEQLRSALDHYALPSALYLEVDVDPVSLL